MCVRLSNAVCSAERLFCSAAAFLMVNILPRNLFIYNFTLSVFRVRGLILLPVRNMKVATTTRPPRESVGGTLSGLCPVRMPLTQVGG